MNKSEFKDCFVIHDSKGVHIKVHECEFVTSNGSRLNQPSGFEITRLSDCNRVFMLNLRGFTKRFIRNHKLKGLK